MSSCPAAPRTASRAPGRRPGLSPIVSDIGPSIIALYKKGGVVRVDPHIVVIPVRGAHPFPGLTAILRFKITRCHGIQDLRIFWIHFYVGIVKGPGADPAVGRDMFKGFPLVGGFI